jgi:5'-nucleotidase
VQNSAQKIPVRAGGIQYSPARGNLRLIFASPKFTQTLTIVPPMPLQNLLRSHVATPLLLPFFLLLLSACQSQPPASTALFAPLEINIAHINDHHANLEPLAAFEFKIDGQPTRVEAGGFPRLTALFKASADLPNLLKIHAGDAMTGTLYHTLYKGEADAALMNTVCFDAFELGNHEFDEGDAGLRIFLDYLRAGPCQTPVLAANVEPMLGTPLAPNGRNDYLQPYVLKQFGDITVAIVGIEARDKTLVSSRPLPSTRIADEATTAQRHIDELKARGIRHIVLVTHQGYENDKALAARLSDVDVIIGADSHTLLGDFSAVGLNAAGPYPTVVRNRDGDSVCIAHAWEYTKAFGLLNVRFNAQGAIDSCGGRATLVIGDDFRQKNGAGKFVPLDAAARQTMRARLANEPSVRVVAPDPTAQAELARFSGRLQEMKQQKIGMASEALCLVRVPGEATNRSAGITGCEAANTLARGSDIAQAVAEAYRQASQRADIALQNGGGIRSALPKGEVTISTAHTVLPFSNTLIELQISGRQLLNVLEDAVANHLDNRSSDGSHPYAAGLRWHLDLSKARDRRFSKLEVHDRTSGAWLPLDPERIYTLVTSDYLAEGGDGYASLAVVHKNGRSVNTYFLYTQTFIDYLQRKGTLVRPAAADYSHQQVIAKDGRPLELKLELEKIAR